MIAWLLALAIAAGPPVETRAALVIGRNDGGDPWTALRYAEDDARRVGDVLVERGRFPAEQVRVLTGASVAAVLDALGHLRAAPPDLLVVYYSGHADAEGLRLGDEHLAYADFKVAIRAVDARSRVVIVDACQAGGLRAKAGAGRVVPGPPEVVWRGPPVQGEILLAASAVDERAFEDAALGGSVFTHHLVIGLMGAADDRSEPDGRVTVDEAFDYAQRSTSTAGLRRREGSQTPWIARDAVGSAPPLTFREEQMGELELGAGFGGRVSIQNQGVQPPRIDGDYDKPAASPVVVWLAEGPYEIRVRSPEGLRVRPIEVEAGRRVVVDGPLEAWTLEPYASDAVEAKGAVGGWHPFVGLGWQAVSGWLRGAGSASGLVLQGGVRFSGWRLGADLEWLGNTFSRPDAHGVGVVESLVIDEYGLSLHGLRAVLDARSLRVEAGLELGAAIAARSTRWPGGRQSSQSLVLSGGLRLGALVPVWRGWAVALDVDPGGRAFEEEAVGWRVEPTIGAIIGARRTW